MMRFIRALAGHGEQIALRGNHRYRSHHPAWYRLLIAPNEEAMEARPGDHFVLVTRIHTMNAETPENLLRFLSKYEHVKAFILTPG
jgi:hypothetical protein